VLLLFGAFGCPTHKGGDVELCSYVFNGDFVDRGAHQCELVALLFALKVLCRGGAELGRSSLEMGRMASASPRRASE